MHVPDTGSPRNTLATHATHCQPHHAFCYVDVSTRFAFQARTQASAVPGTGMLPLMVRGAVPARRGATGISLSGATKSTAGWIMTTRKRSSPACIWKVGAAVSNAGGAMLKTQGHFSGIEGCHRGFCVLVHTSRMHTQPNLLGPCLLLAIKHAGPDLSDVCVSASRTQAKSRLDLQGSLLLRGVCGWVEDAPAAGKGRTQLTPKATPTTQGFLMLVRGVWVQGAQQETE